MTRFNLKSQRNLDFPFPIKLYPKNPCASAANKTKTTMNTYNQISSRLCLLGAAIIALAGAVGSQTLHASTTWNGGGGADTTITNDLNWGGTVNALNGTTGAAFGSGGSSATLNTNAQFSGITFNRVGGFLIDGSSNLRVNNSGSSGTFNLVVSSAQGAGATVINTPFFVDTTTGGAAKLLVLDNQDPSASPNLIFSNKVAATVPANVWSFRLKGTGTTKFVGAISNCSGVLMNGTGAAGSASGGFIFSGNQALGSGCPVSSGAPGATSSSLIQMGDTSSDIQSWGATTVSGIGTIQVNSTANIGAVAVENSAANANPHGGVFVVNGALSATTLTIGGAAYAGGVKIGGSAYFSGAVSIGATAGSSIVGNALTPGTLMLSSGTISGNVTIGGAGANENNLTLIKTNSGALTLGGTHTYTGNTIIKAGQLDLTGTIASSITVSNGATLGGEGATPGSVTFGSGTTTFSFDPSTAGFFSANSIDGSAGTVLVFPLNNSSSGVVMQSTNPIVGSIGANFLLAARTGAGTLSFNGDHTQLIFTVGTPTPLNLTWLGNAVKATNWDSGVTINWTNGTTTDRFYAGDTVLFDDTASSSTVFMQGSVLPANMVISNNTRVYTFSGGSIGGTGGLTKNGSTNATISSGANNFSGGLTVNNGTLSLTAVNTFTGGVTNNGGTLVIASIGSIGGNTGSTPSLNSVNLNGGTFSYTNTTITSETLTFNLLGGTSTINVSADAQTLRTGAPVTGPGNLVKTGLGTLALGQNSITPLGSTFTGNILVTGGQLDIRHADSLGDVAGSTTVSNATLYIDPFGQAWGATFNAEPLVFFGNSYIRNYDQSATVAQINTLTGPITNNGTLNIFSQTNGGYGELDITGDITNTAGSSLILGGVAIGNNGTTGPSTNGQVVTISGAVSGPASVSAVGDSTSVYTLANNIYSGNTTVRGGTLKLGLATLAANSIVTVTNNAVLQLDFTGVTNTIGSLVLNGVTQPAGVYDSTTGAPYITGSGSLLVVPPVSTNANLISFVLSPAGTLSPTFASNVTTYAATEAYVNVPTVTVVNADLTATNHLIFNGATNLLASGAASSPLNLTLGVNNPVVVQVTAQDGITVKTYTVNVTRQPSLTPATLTNSVSGSTLTLSWPGDHLGYSLQAQTNSLSSGLGTNWVTLPGSASVTTTNLPIINVNPTVFYRLVYP